MKDYEIGDIVKVKRDKIQTKAVITDKRVSFGHNEWKVDPVGEGVEINGWVRKFNN